MLCARAEMPEVVCQVWYVCPPILDNMPATRACLFPPHLFFFSVPPLPFLIQGMEGERGAMEQVGRQRCANNPPPALKQVL